MFKPENLGKNQFHRERLFANEYCQILTNVLTLSEQYRNIENSVLRYRLIEYLVDEIAAPLIQRSRFEGLPFLLHVSITEGTNAQITRNYVDVLEDSPGQFQATHFESIDEHKAVFKNQTENIWLAVFDSRDRLQIKPILPGDPEYPN